jgi:hypothetical protein
MSTPQSLPEKLEELAAAAERESQEALSTERRLYCEGTAHGLREAARMVRLKEVYQKHASGMRSHP